jgi:Ni/Fe-hydrogenase subunit HybB-like protein
MQAEVGVAAGRRTGRLWAYAGLAALGLAGLVALGLRLQQGLRTTALTSSISWGLWVALYIYFVGLSAGSFLLSTLIYVFGMHRLERVGRMALLSAFFALAGALLFIWVDLGHPERFWEVFLFPNFRSVMTVETFLYLLYLVLILAELWLLMREDMASLASLGGLRGRILSVLSLGYSPPLSAAERERDRRRARAWVRVLGSVGVPVAIGVHGGTGAIFAVVQARPYWFGGLFPIVFLVSALASGAALVTFLYALFGERDEEGESLLRTLGALTVLFLALDLLFLASETLTAFYSRNPEHTEVWRAMTVGRYAAVFWVGQLVMAGLAPILLVALAGRSARPRLYLGAAGALAVAGVLAIRLNIVIPAFVRPEVPGLDLAYQGPRLAYSYFPSLGEWAITVGLVALGVLAFSIALDLLPFRETPEVVAARAAVERARVEEG